MCGESVQLTQRWLRRERRPVLGAPEHAEQTAHLVDGLAAGYLDRRQRLAHVRLLALEDARRCARLDDDHADVVCDDVVQLAGDPGALVDDRDSRLQFPLLVELERERLELDRPLPATMDDPPDQPGGADPAERRQEVGLALEPDD